MAVFKDNLGLEYGQSTFRTYIANTPEFKAYFEEHERLSSLHSGILYETSDGEQVEINVAVLMLSYSRMRFFYMSISKSQAVLFSFLTDEARAEHFVGCAICEGFWV